MNLPAIQIPSFKSIQQATTLSVSITSPETEVQARGYLTEIDKALKQLDKDVKAINKPYKDEIDKNNKAAKEWKLLLEEKYQKIEQGILGYVNKMRAKVAAQNTKAIQKFEKKIDQAAVEAVQNGTPVPLILPPALAVEPAKTVDLGEAGKQTITVHRKWRLPVTAPDYYRHDPERLDADVSMKMQLLIPLEYFVLDTAKIGRIIRGGGSIPGIEMYLEESIAIKS